MLEKALAGPLNLLVKFSTLQEYGVDKPFFLENDNVDSSQRNVVFLVRGEKAKTVMAVASMSLFQNTLFLNRNITSVYPLHWTAQCRILWGSKVDYVDSSSPYLISFDPYSKSFNNQHFHWITLFFSIWGESIIRC